MALMRRSGCAAAAELLKKVAERGPWVGVLQDALDWVRAPSCRCQIRLLPCTGTACSWFWMAFACA